MELRHLRYFVAVAEEENVSRAALKLHVSQPALSRQIRDLEDELGFLLLKRSAKSVHLTEAGRTFLAESRAVLQRVEEAIKTTRTIATGGGGELHVGYAMTPTVHVLPQTLRAFQSERPNIRVKLHDMSTEEMLAGLRKGKLQIALLVCPNPAMVRGFRFEELLRLGMCIAVAPKHPFASRRSVKLAELAAYPLVALSRSEFPDYHAMLAVLFATGKTKPHIAEEHESITSLMASVEAGNGVALVPESMACVAGPRLKLTQLSPAPQPLIVAAVWPERGLSDAAEQFLDCARSAAKSEPATSASAKVAESTGLEPKL